MGRKKASNVVDDVEGEPAALNPKKSKKKQQTVDDDEYMVLEESDKSGSKPNGVALEGEDDLTASFKDMGVSQKKEKKKTKGDVEVEDEDPALLNAGKKGVKGKKGRKNHDDDDSEFGINGSTPSEGPGNGTAGDEDVDELVSFSEKKKGKGKSKKGKDQNDDFEVTSQTSALESVDHGDEDEDTSVSSGKKKGKLKNKKSKDVMDDYDIPLSEPSVLESVGSGEKAEEEDPIVFGGKKKGKGKNKKGKDQDDDFEATFEMAKGESVPDLVTETIDKEDEDETSLFTGKKKGKKRREQTDDTPLLVDTSVTDSVVDAGIGAEDEEEDESTLFSGNEKSKGNSRKGVHLLVDDDFEAVLAEAESGEPEPVTAPSVLTGMLEEEEEEEIIFTGKKKKKGGAKKVAAFLLDEDMADSEVASENSVAPPSIEGEKEELEEDPGLFAGKKKGKKGKKDKKPLKEDEDIDALMAELEDPHTTKDELLIGKLMIDVAVVRWKCVDFLCQIELLGS